VRQCGDLFLGLNQNACNWIEKMKWNVLARQRFLAYFIRCKYVLYFGSNKNRPKDSIHGFPWIYCPLAVFHEWDFYCLWKLFIILF
jgi:hypothetical protein